MSEMFSADVLTAFLQVVMIDLVLAGDNAIVIGLAAAGLPKEQRNKAILVGIVAATVLRIVFAALTTQLLQIVGLLLAGGVLLLWVCWKMWRELRTSQHDEEEAERALAGENGDYTTGGMPRKTFAQAAWQILVLSIALMGLAASFIARLLQRHRWIAYVGLAVILYVALEMIYRGWLEVAPLVAT